MNKILILFAFCVFALLYSCGDDAQNNIPVGEANLYLTVQDASNGDWLENADVTIGSTKGKTEDNGLAKLKIQAGSHSWLVEKEGYASARGIIETDDFARGTTSVVGDVYENTLLYPATATLKGTLYNQNSNGKSVPMPNMPIRLDFPPNFNLAQTSYDCGKTDEKGEYICKDLPAVGSSSLYSIYVLGSEDFLAAKLVSRATLLPGATANNMRDNYNELVKDKKVAFTLLEVPSFVETANKGEALTLKFTEAVDVSLFMSTWVTASQSVNVKWEACDEKNVVCGQLKLTPIPDWKNGTQINLNGIKSISGQSLSLYFILKVPNPDISDKQVTGVKVLSTNPARKDSIFYEDTQARITWNKLAGAIRYEVFVQTSDATNFESVGTTTDTIFTVDINRFSVSNSSSSSSSATVTAVPIGSKVNKVVVQAVTQLPSSSSATSSSSSAGPSSLNNSSKSKFSDVVEIKAIDDGKAPTYATSGTRVQDPCVYVNSTSCRLGYITAQSVSPDANGIIDFYQYPTGTNNSNGIAVPNKLTPYEFTDQHNLAAKLSTTQADDIALGRVFFNKPMDAASLTQPKCTPDPTNVAAKACDKLKLSASWNNDQNLKLTVTTTEGNVATGLVNVVYSIEGLKGKNTKTFDDIKIRFTTEDYCNTSAGSNDYTNCLTQYCASHTTDYTNCANTICEAATSYDANCSTWCSDTDNSSKPACETTP